MDTTNPATQAIILKPGKGRTYPCGKMTAVFKTDEEETSEKYSVSEWWLEANTHGPGAHKHDDNDEVFYVLEGTVSFLVGEKWIDAEKGTFLRIPSKMMHDFANNTAHKAGVLNFYTPGGFERNMPSIVKWFEENGN